MFSNSSQPSFDSRATNRIADSAANISAMPGRRPMKLLILKLLLGQVKNTCHKVSRGNHSTAQIPTQIALYYSQSLPRHVSVVRNRNIPETVFLEPYCGQLQGIRHSSANSFIGHFENLDKYYLKTISNVCSYYSSSFITSSLHFSQTCQSGRSQGQVQGRDDEVLGLDSVGHAGCLLRLPQSLI